MGNSGYVIVTHTDTDGVGAASIYIYYQAEEPMRILFTEPYLLEKTLKKLREIDNVSIIALMDLGMNPNTYPVVRRELEKIVSRGAVVEWYDHHVWDNDWIKGLKDIGVKIYIDRSTCATGVVAKYAPRRNNDIDKGFVNELVAGICAGDLWRFDHWRGPWYHRLVKRNDDPKWRLYVVEKMSKGNVWCNEFTHKIIERIEMEINTFREIDKTIITKSFNGLGIVGVLRHPLIENSVVAAYAMGRTGTAVAVVVSKDGKVSLRSRGIDIRNVAVRLGGGGHPQAAGFKAKIPFLLRLKSFFNSRVVVEYVVDLLGKELCREKDSGTTHDIS